ncbi:MAG: alkaline phosphatase [Candidatus Methanofastidiosia archaeon]
MKRKLSILISSILILSIISSCVLQERETKSVILMIGDGMGDAHLRMASLYSGKELFIDTLPILSKVKTNSFDSEITDSAAAATAMATGYKTNNNMISMSSDGTPLKTILELAKEKGKSTGLVTTTRITHATPAAFAAHNVSRYNEEEILKDYLENEVDVLFGGGLEYFLSGERKDGIDYLEKFREKGYEVLRTRNELLSADTSQDAKLLGLFAKSHMSYVFENSSQPTLSEMTKVALERLSKDEDGFLLMIEGGRIDHASHENDALKAIEEILAFDEAVGVAIEFAKSERDVLLIVTADHETGGLELGDGNLQVLRGLRENLSELSKKIMKNPYDLDELIASYLGIYDLTIEEREMLKNPTKATLKKFIEKRASISWSSDYHTSKPISLKAFGPSSELFSSELDNTDIAKLIMEALGLTERFINNFRYT